MDARLVRRRRPARRRVWTAAANGFVDLGPGVIIGMETPHGAARWPAASPRCDAVVDAIGLATDGGYWMIGLAPASIRAVFDGVPMSTSAHRLAQLRALHHLGRPCERLPIARDLDTFDDLRAVGRIGRTARRLAEVAHRDLRRDRADSSGADRPR